MAHLITETDSAIFYKEPAWHNLGMVVPEELSPKEGMIRGGLGWTVSKSDGIVVNGVHTNKYVGIVRDDNKSILSIQSPRFQVIQNLEMAEMAELLGSTVKMESALSLSGGREVILLMRGDTFSPGNSKGDEIARYLALINSHGGLLAFSALPTSVRIVCANTLAMALSQGKKNMFRVTHTGNMDLKKAAMEQALMRYKETGDLFQTRVDAMSSRTMTTEEVQRFWLDVWGMLVEPVVPNPTTEKEEANNLAAASEIALWSKTFDQERSTLKAPASAWQAANAVTKNLQHRKTRRSFDSRAFANLAGTVQDDTLKVMRKALALV